MLLALSQLYVQGLHKWLLVCNPSSSVVRLLYALSPFELLEQNPTVWAAYRQHKVISHISGAEIKAPATVVFHQLPDSQPARSLCTHRWWKEWGSSEESVIRTLIRFMKALPSWPKHLPRAPLCNIIAVGLWAGGWLGFQHSNLRGMQTFRPHHILSSHRLYFLSCMVVVLLMAELFHYWLHFLPACSSLCPSHASCPPMWAF